MLSSDDLITLAAAVCATAETLGQTLSAGAAKLIAEDLADYQPQDIRAALQACRRELTGKLTLAAILQRVQAADGRPEPNEAWALALGASDETDSAVLTEEIQLAMGASQAVLDAGDKIGARMAFLSAYQRFVDAARREAKPVRWALSMGYDPQRRVAAVQAAVRLGRLTDPQAQQYIAQLSYQPATQDGAAIAGLITGRAAMPTPELRERLQLVKAEVKAFSVEREELRVAEIEAHQEDLARRRADQLAALEELTQRSAAQ